MVYKNNIVIVMTGCADRDGSKCGFILKWDGRTGKGKTGAPRTTEKIQTTGDGQGRQKTG